MPEVAGNRPVWGALTGIMAVVFAGAVCASQALAQAPDDGSKFGAVVSVAGTGGDVKAVGARISVDGSNARVKAAGAAVDIRGVIEGNVWAAGADVTVAAQIGGAARALGARVAVRGRVAGDVAAAGAIVDIDLAAGGNLRAAGASVRIGALSDIKGDISAAGASVVFDGQVAGDARFAGAVVTINGPIGGAVTVHAERLIVGPRAVIAGDLLVRSLVDPTIDPGAAITGKIVHESPGRWFDDLPEVSAAIVAAAFAVSVLLSGVILLIFARNTYGEAVDHVRFRPVSSALYGILAVIVLFAMSAILMVTIVGIGLGIALLLLLPAVFVVSQPVAAAGIVGWLFGRGNPRLGIPSLILFLVFGGLVIGFSGLIPFTGPWIVLATMIFGIGGFLRATLWRFRSARDSDQNFGSGAAAQRLGQK